MVPSPFVAGFHDAIRGAGPVMELRPSELSDWLSSEAARDEIRERCRRWLAELPELDAVDIRDRRRALETVTR